MALATVDAEGLPNVRMVLLKGFDERGFVFYSNEDSQKGRETGPRTPRPASAFHWKSLRRQGPPAAGPRLKTVERRQKPTPISRAPPAFLPDRRLGEQAVCPARKPATLSKKAIALKAAQFAHRASAATAILDRLPRSCPP